MRCACERKNATVLRTRAACAHDCRKANLGYSVPAMKTSASTHSPVCALAIFAVTVSACNNDPGKGKAQATVGSATAALTAPAASAVNYAFSNEGSTFEFVGAKITAKNEGSFAAFRGNIALVDGDPVKSSVSAEVDTASLTAQPEKLANHLKSADFLDVAKFPKAKFSSTAIKAGGENGATQIVTGNLELHGVTRAITFPAQIKLEGDTVSVLSEFSIKRKDFSIVYPGMPDDLIKDEVLLKLSLHAKK